MDVNKQGLHVVHGFLKASQKSYFSANESMRILLNACKITTNLYGTLSYCVTWPSAMNGILAAAALLTLDVITELKLPCFFTQFDYYDRAFVAIVAPVALLGVALAGGLLWAQLRRLREERGPDHAHADDSVVVEALWIMAPILGVIDFVYPLLTRTLLQFFTCRKLEAPIDSPNGLWLEADYSLECYTPQYKAIAPIVAIFAFLYSFGIPAIFLGLILRFKERGRAGEEKIERALGWIYRPFRQGREWWRVVEMLRVLFLTSCVGFLASRCWMKLLAAQVIAHSFLVVFLLRTPYRRLSHNFMQIIAMLIPVLSLAWAAAGGWEHQWEKMHEEEAEPTGAWSMVALRQECACFPTAFFYYFAAEEGTQR